MFSNFFKPLSLSDDEEDFDEDYDYSNDYDDDEYEDEAPKAKPVKQPKARVPKFGRSSESNKIVQISREPERTGLNVHVIVPDKNAVMKNILGPAKELADILKSGKTVVLNLENVPEDISQQILNFVYGAVYYSESNIRQAAQYVFVCTPQDINISGNVPDTNLITDNYSNGYSLDGSNTFGSNNGAFY